MCSAVVSLTGCGEGPQRLLPPGAIGPCRAPGASREPKNPKKHLVPSPCPGQQHLPAKGSSVTPNLIFCWASWCCKRRKTANLQNNSKNVLENTSDVFLRCHWCGFMFLNTSDMFVTYVSDVIFFFFPCGTHMQSPQHKS